MDFIHPNELIDQNGGAADPLPAAERCATRGYRAACLPVTAARRAAPDA